MHSIDLKIRRIDHRQHDIAAEFLALRAELEEQGNIVNQQGRRRTLEVFGKPLTPRQVAQTICEDIARDGIRALLDYSVRIDKVPLTADTLRVKRSELESAHRQASQQLLATVRVVRANIQRFQQAILNSTMTIELPGGGFLQQRYTPLDRVGICVPGGAAAYPSTVLMTAVPAQAAGVGQLAVVAPPTEFGAYNRDVLATCHELGIDEVYRVGGAQAVAALAYGVEGIEPVEKIVGPGNLFVAMAKQFVFGLVGIDSIAGPSEIVVIADETTRPDYAAADLIAQAEHAPGASFMISTSEKVLEATEFEISKQLAHLERRDAARESLEQFGAMILAKDPNEAANIANLIAPEHLHIATDDATAQLDAYKKAGAVFLGPYSPVALGDYVAGPSHVLPTGGTARFTGGLTCNDFLRASSVVHFSRDALAGAADDIRALAETEGLTAHRASVDIRLEE